MSVVLAATPIGNPEDASPRLRHMLATADVVAAEDTRRLRRLVSVLGIEIRGRVVSFHDSVERERVAPLLDAAGHGQTVLVVTDAGMPLVSDPGFRLVSEAVARGIPITVIPGPSAVLAALALSGLATDRWCFEGFLPRRAGERRHRLAELAGERRTMVFFEAPHRLAAMLADLATGFGPDRQAAACRELTKTYEEVRRGSLGELAQWATGEVRGELTIVVAGASEVAVEVSDDAVIAAVTARVDSGESRRDAIDAVAVELGLPRRRVYAAATSASRH